MMAGRLLSATMLTVGELGREDLYHATALILAMLCKIRLLEMQNCEIPDMELRGRRVLKAHVLQEGMKEHWNFQKEWGGSNP